MSNGSPVEHGGVNHARDAFASDLAVSKLCTNTDELINLSVDDLVHFVQLYTAIC